MPAHAVLLRFRESWLSSSLTPITFSAGIAVVAEGDGYDRAMGPLAVQAADALMYEAKAAGRDRVQRQPSVPPVPLLPSESLASKHRVDLREAGA